MSKETRDSKHSSQLTKDTEVQITTLLGYLELFICVAFIILRFLFDLEGAGPTIVLPLMACFLYGTYKTKTSRNPNYGLFLYLPVVFIFIPYRMLTNGGLYSPSALWFCVLPVTFLAFYYRFASPISIIFSIFSLVSCYFLHIYGYLQPPSINLTSYLINLIAQVAAVFFIMMIVDQSRKKLELELSQLKNETTKNNMIATLNHEINNPLAIMSAKLQIAQGNKDWNMVMSAQKEIDRINMTLLQIKQISEGNLSKSDYRQSEDSNNVQIYNIRH